MISCMARTPSNQDLPLSSTCPAFELTDVVTGRALSRDDIFGGPDDHGKRTGLLVAFLSVHCPFVQHMEAALTAVAADFADRIATVAICSNDEVTVPEDAPEHMRAQAARLGWSGIGGKGLPYLSDASQETARDFHAACTPDLYLFDADLKLVYHAQFDATRPYRESDAANGVIKDERIHQAAHGSGLRSAIEALLAGRPPLEVQTPSLGCNIKWR